MITNIDSLMPFKLQSGELHVLLIIINIFYLSFLFLYYIFYISNNVVELFSNFSVLKYVCI